MAAQVQEIALGSASAPTEVEQSCLSPSVTEASQMDAVTEASRLDADDYWRCPTPQVARPSPAIPDGHLGMHSDDQASHMARSTEASHILGSTAAHTATLHCPPDSRAGTVKGQASATATAVSTAASPRGASTSPLASKAGNSLLLYAAGSAAAALWQGRTGGAEKVTQLEGSSGGDAWKRGVWAESPGQQAVSLGTGNEAEGWASGRDLFGSHASDGAFWSGESLLHCPSTAPVSLGEEEADAQGRSPDWVTGTWPSPGFGLTPARMGGRKGLWVDLRGRAAGAVAAGPGARTGPAAGPGAHTGPGSRIGVAASGPGPVPRADLSLAQDGWDDEAGKLESILTSAEESSALDLTGIPTSHSPHARPPALHGPPFAAAPSDTATSSEVARLQAQVSSPLFPPSLSHGPDSSPLIPLFLATTSSSMLYISPELHA